MNLSRPLSILFIAVMLSTSLFASGKDDGPQSTLNFVVLKDDNGKPVRNAAVILHPVGQHGKQTKGGFELKTDNEGKTHFDGIPYGKMRVQVIANGFQTFGDDYTVSQSEQEITIRLQRPHDQYSIYQSHDGQQQGTGGGNTTVPGTAAPSTPK